MNVDNIWNSFLEKIQKQITPISYETWFKDTKLKELKDGRAIVIVPMSIHIKQLSENYKEIIENTFNELTGTNFNFDYILESDIIGEMVEDIGMVGVPKQALKNTNLIKNYTFENYVVGESNRFAYTAALAVAENPGKMYNPLFIYGSSGLGKTHLMHAIGNYIVQNTNKMVLYVTSEQFISDFLGINRKGEENNNFDFIKNFKKKYRNVDVLLVDDIQFLETAQKTQQEFFHTFNDLHKDQKQIVITSDRSPNDFRVLEERLKTRFDWGLRVNILPPDQKLREEIIRNKMAKENCAMPIPNDVIEFIANNCSSDVRQLEGVITRLYAYVAMFNKQDITLEIAVEGLKDYFVKNTYMKSDIQKIQSAIASYYKISLEDMKSKRRKADITVPRQVAMYLCRILTKESFPKIGVEFGGKDHTTVMHACEKIESEIKKDKDFEKLIDKLKNEIL